MTDERTHGDASAINDEAAPPALKHAPLFAQAAIRDICNRSLLTEATAREVIRVEVDASRTLEFIGLFTDEQVDTMIDPGFAGPPQINGTSYYIVPKLDEPEGWRVRVPSGL